MFENLLRIIEIQHTLLYDIVNRWDPKVVQSLSEIDELLEQIKEQQKLWGDY